MNPPLIARFEKRFAAETVIRGDLEFPADRFHATALFGPSGCGKTTVLRCLAGLERPDVGQIRFGAQIWYDSAQNICLTPQERNIGFLFQEFALFPHLTVGENIAYGLQRLQWADAAGLVQRMLQRIQLTDYGDRYPYQLSGGQQQRVALARTLVRRPQLLLLDEPLSALDAGLRETLRLEMREMLQEFGIPLVIVTHDRTEVLALAEDVVLMHAGRVLQSGPVAEVFRQPTSIESAQIVGVETILTGTITAERSGFVVVNVHGSELLAPPPRQSAAQVHICLRAEDVQLLTSQPTSGESPNQFAVRVRWIIQEGPLVRVGLAGPFELTALLTRREFVQLGFREDDQLTAHISPDSLHLIPVG
jgi:molybdate transport system ATP-binding protein